MSPTTTPTGVESTLEVPVDGLQWDERSSMYGAEPEDRAHATRDEPDGSVVGGLR